MVFLKIGRRRGGRGGIMELIAINLLFNYLTQGEECYVENFSYINKEGEILCIYSLGFFHGPGCSIRISIQNRI